MHLQHLLDWVGEVGVGQEITSRVIESLIPLVATPTAECSEDYVVMAMHASYSGAKLFRAYISSPRLRQLIFLRKSDCLGCAVLLCIVVCLTLLASFFVPSHLSLKHILKWCAERHASIIYIVPHLFGTSGERSKTFPLSSVYVQAFRSYLDARQHVTAADNSSRQTRANAMS